MFGPGMLTFREFAMQEQLPLSTIQQAVLEYLSGRDDVVLFGAQAVNAYVAEPRMTQDIDLLALEARAVAQDLHRYLSDRFHIAVRVREIGEGRGYRLYQVQKSGNRHLVDIRQTGSLPHTREIAGIQVMAPADLVASKVISYYQRRGKPKSGTDWRDLALLLLTFPELKSVAGPVHDELEATGAEAAVFDLWRDLVDQEIRPEDEDDEF
jgi:hypothetical protein